jgi:hypothetical protein
MRAWMELPSAMPMAPSTRIFKLGVGFGMSDVFLSCPSQHVADDGVAFDARRRGYRTDAGEWDGIIVLSPARHPHSEKRGGGNSAKRSSPPAASTQKRMLKMKLKTSRWTRAAGRGDRSREKAACSTPAHRAQNEKANETSRLACPKTARLVEFLRHSPTAGLGPGRFAKRGDGADGTSPTQGSQS